MWLPAAQARECEDLEGSQERRGSGAVGEGAANPERAGFTVLPDLWLPTNPGPVSRKASEDKTGHFRQLSRALGSGEAANPRLRAEIPFCFSFPPILFSGCSMRAA